MSASKTVELTPTEADAVRRFSDLMAGLRDDDDRSAVMRRVKARVNVKDSANGGPPAPVLLTAEDKAVQDAEHRAHAETVVSDLYGHARDRLAGDDPDAEKARAHAASVLIADHGLPLSQTDAEALVKRTAAVGTSLGLLGRRSGIGRMLRDGVPDPQPLAGAGDLSRRLLLRGQLASFQGHPEALKSAAAVACGVDYMLAGGRLVWMDWENGEEEAARKIRDIGAAMVPAGVDFDALCDERLFHAYMGGLEPDWEQAAEVAEAFPDALWVWDSARGIIRSFPNGGDENSAKDVGLLLDPLDVFTKSGKVAASVLIDHVTKPTTKDNKYARGAGDKLGAMQIAWYFEVNQQPDRSTPGRITVHNKKNRSGSLPGVQSFVVGDGKGGLGFTSDTPDETPTGRRERAVIALLKAQHPKRLSVRGIRDAKGVDGTPAVSGRPDDVKATVEHLAQATGRPVRVVNEAGVARYEYVPEADAEPQQGLAV